MWRHRCHVAAALLATGMAGCSAPSADRDSVAREARPLVQGASLRPHARVEPRSGAERAADVARAFALAARDWAPDGLKARWRRQVRLSTGELRAALRRTPPRQDDVARLRADHAQVTTSIEGVVVDHATAGVVAVTIRVAERITLRGATTDQFTDNRAIVVRHGRGWRVRAFGLAP